MENPFFDERKHCPMSNNFFTKLDAPLKIFLFLGVISALVVGFISLRDVASLKEDLMLNAQKKSDSIPPVDDAPQNQQIAENCGLDCEEKISVAVDKAVAELSAELKASSGKQVTQSTPKPKPAITQVFYVPVGSSGSTTKTEWADLSNTDFFFNSGEYGTLKDAKWSANIKVFQNGQAFARLFDVTHGVAVPGSEISTASYVYSLVESDSLKFLQDKNVYRVQMKSLTGYEASFDSGKIKIVSEQ